MSNDEQTDNLSMQKGCSSSKLSALSVQILEKLPKRWKEFAFEIDGRSSRRRTESQVDGPSDDKVTEKGDPGERSDGIQIFPQMTDVEEFPLRYSL